MRLSALGLNHKTSPIAVRERIAFADREILPALTGLRGLRGITECLLLSTCNRTEVYLVTALDPPIGEVSELLGTLRGVPAAVFAPAFYVHHDLEAARHALRVAAGLDSMVVGEEQILGQVRRAFDVARGASVTGPVLNRLMQLAIATGRRVRRETELSRHAPSIPRAALALCQRALGSVRGRQVLVVGAGKTASLASTVFAAAGATIAAIANRTPDGARTLAGRVGAQPISLDQLPQALDGADIVVVCAGAAAPIVTREMLARAIGRRAPLLVADLGMPRGVDPAAAGLPGVTLHTLDALPAPAALPSIPADHLARADEIVEEALSRFESWIASRAAVPVIEALRQQVEAIVTAELARARPRLRDLDADQRETVRVIVEAVAHKLLHTPIVRLRESAARRDALILESAKELFGLDARAPEPGGIR
ncbi:MAG: glutamyl-tRNA reductase [Armatimonadetes bacterium]|nr:glutamyl-tRNA reductase [Armatimonadota bacterium]